MNDAEHGRFGYSAVFGSDAGNPDLVEGGGFNLFTTSFNGHQPPVRDFETNDFVFGAIFDDPELGGEQISGRIRTLTVPESGSGAVLLSLGALAVAFYRKLSFTPRAVVEGMDPTQTAKTEMLRAGKPQSA